MSELAADFSRHRHFAIRLIRLGGRRMGGSLLIGALGAAAGPGLAADQVRATLELQPVVSEHVAEMRVVEHLPADMLPSGQTLTLAFATMAPAYRRTADTVQSLVAQDDLGPLPLVGPTREDNDDLWRAGRATHGDVLVRYVVPAAPHDVPHSGPITYLQNSGGGLSGAFASFLLAPRVDTPIDIAVRWRLPAGQHAVSNQQIGDFARRTTFSELAGTLFVAGPLRYAPQRLSDRTLVVAGLGRPAEDVVRARQWFAKVFPVMRDAFQGDPRLGYRIMFFSHDRQSFDSGTSRSGGFLYFLPADARLDDQKNHSIIAHEMVHSLVAGYLPDTDGPGDWYNEGIADYAALVVPNAAGLYTPREYLDLVNAEAAFYYLNPLRQTPNAEIAESKWSKNNAWSLGYTRGALYFANLDAGLRAHGAKLTVIDLVGKMNALGEDHSLGPDDWERVLQQSAGPWALAEWRAMLAGQLLQPVPGAFGPCLVARPITAGHYALGFSTNTMGKGDRVAHVVPGSSAFNAGLRDGDILREAFVEHGLNERYDSQATVKVTRDGKALDITYSPREGKELAYRWFPRSGNPDRPCD
ncbi:hypothetical protein [Xanthomonas sp. D-109]|uniref:hypothetical protein n=1 Tax=Xanthomonas sp. D-109 TaxID=2821274 RepID=UPI001ADBF174|nr:hypothetical protein [Xanthomonas sp. D-109]MBO9882480.1 hypothetical protein [Xanthomonas sp. D-109]